MTIVTTPYTFKDENDYYSNKIKCFLDEIK